MIYLTDHQTIVLQRPMPKVTFIESAQYTLHILVQRFSFKFYLPYQQNPPIYLHRKCQEESLETLLVSHAFKVVAHQIQNAKLHWELQRPTWEKWSTAASSLLVLGLVSQHPRAYSCCQCGLKFLLLFLSVSLNLWVIDCSASPNFFECQH